MNRFSGFSLLVAVLAAVSLAGCPPTATVDFNTQNFAAGAAATALAGKQLYFSPDGSISFYSRTVTDGISEFLNTDTQSVIDFADADPFVLPLASGAEAMYYGIAYNTLYIGSNGTIAFGAPGTGNSSLANHFRSNQISLLPVDAGDAAETGNVSYVVNNNSIVITFDAVDGSSFQCVLYTAGSTDNDIAIVYPIIDVGAGGVVGLSRGQLAGANQAEIDAFLADFNPSDLSANNTSTAKLGF